ncbi:hypothetical protein L7F22_050349 [Adiantum nelumboides]|nr:hypothetical protein [Adiantum nelumboides]
MKRLSRIRKECIAVIVVCAVLAALFLPISSFPNLLLTGHVVLNNHLLKHPHIQTRLFSELTPPSHSAAATFAKSSVRNVTRNAIAQRALSSLGAEHHVDRDRRNLSQAKGMKLQEGCTKSKACLKVFMYDLPSELHFGMIDPTSVEKGQTWPTDLANTVNYPGGLYQQHSPEYWLTLDLLSSLEEEEKLPKREADVTTSRPCVAIRVRNARDADVYFVPFFASLSYNKYGRMRMKERDEELQRKVVEYVVKQKAWKRSKGRDHVIVMHHPNSLHMARALLGEAIFIVADFGRASSKVSHLGKDVVAPYKHIVPTFFEDHFSFESRPTLLFFQGAIHRKEGGFIRQKLYNLMKEEKGVVFKDGSFNSASLKSATKGMRSSKFCLHLAGDTPSSNRLFDAIVSHCVPVILSKDIELPYEDILDYSKFCLFVNYEEALKRGFLANFLRGIGRKEWTRMWKRLKEVQIHFEYQFPSQDNDATQMVWKSLAHKVPSIKQNLHKQERYFRSYHFES